MPMSDDTQNGLITLIFRSGAGLTKSAQLWVSLHTANPTDAGTGTEVSGGSYARVQRDPGDANWSDPGATSGSTNNVAAITFPAPTANWGVVTHVAVWTASVAGTMRAYAQLTTSKTVNNGDAAPSFNAASLVWTAV